MSIVNLLLHSKCFDKHSKQITLVREEIIAIVTKTVKTFPDEKYDYNLVARILLKVLQDPKHKMKQGAIEGFVILHEKIPDKIRDLANEAPEDIRKALFDRLDKHPDQEETEDDDNLSGKSNSILTKNRTSTNKLIWDPNGLSGCLYLFSRKRNISKKFDQHSPELGNL